MADSNDDSERTAIDFDQPSSARMYDYALGGKDNYEIDREAVEKIKVLVPNVRVIAQQNRNFMHRAVRELAAMGVCQFLDIGTGIPTEPNLHQVAQETAPEARVVYVDNDPIVLAHARALFKGTTEGQTAYIDADLRKPSRILEEPALARTLDLDSPMAVSLVAVLHFMTSEDNPYAIVETLMNATAPGSFLIISHATSDLDPTMDAALERYRESGVHARNRTRAEFERLFGGLELLPPGIVPTNRWRPTVVPPKWQDAQVGCWAGVGRKP